MRNHRKTLLWAVLLLVIPAFVTCCVTNEVMTNAYKALSTAATSYETAFNSLAELYDKGIIGEEEKEKAVVYGAYFWSAYHMAAEALESYKKTESAADEEKLQAALAEMSRLLGKFLEYVGPLLTK